MGELLQANMPASQPVGDTQPNRFAAWIQDQFEAQNVDITQRKKDNRNDAFKSPSINTIMGVQGTDPSDITGHATLKSNGYGVVRVEAEWSLIEQTAGVYLFNTPSLDLDTWINDILSNSMKCICMLKSSNLALYPDTDTMATVAARTAFSNYVHATVRRYSGKGIMWEIWNEPPSTMTYYLTLVQVVSPIIRQYDPSGLILAPTIDSLNASSITRLGDYMTDGLLDYIDAISIHNYQASVPESGTSNYNAVRDLLGSHNRKNFPIVCTEWAYSLYNWFDSTALNLTETEQAHYAVRAIMNSLINGVVYHIWHQYYNGVNETIVPVTPLSPADPNYADYILAQEANFGLIKHDKTTLKPVYNALKTLGTTLGNYSFVRIINTPDPADRVYLLRNKNGEMALALWSTNATSHAINLDLKSNGIGYLVDMLGGVTSQSWTLGYAVNLTDSPQYLLLNEYFDDNIEVLGAVTLLNTWADLSAEAVGYVIDKTGYVQINGSAQNGTTTAGTTIFTLPAGYRPIVYKRYFIADYRIDIDTDGNVIIQSGTPTLVSFDTIRFRAL